MLKRLLKARAGKSRAGLLRTLAGVPAGLRQTRRGSFLVMVVGTLALIAVITVVYVAIGRSDRQASAAAVQFDERRDIPEAMRDYIAGIIAADVFDVVYLGERAPNPNNTANSVPVVRREAWDYPSTAYEVTLPGEATIPYTPSGGNPNADNLGMNIDRRGFFTPTGNYTGTDPFLASPEPTLLNYDGSELNNETEPFNYFRERLDWQHISNIAPDGVFVNLFNLRGNFEATPAEMRGFGNGQPPLLYTAPPQGVNSRGDLTDYFATITDPFSLNAVPAELSSRQRYAAYPAVDPRFGPDQGLHLPYQWADADGDGILDARWFEMVEDRNAQDAGLFRHVFTPDPDIRYFFAARIVDLTGRVNVNTATDQTLSPVEDDPFGLTPAAVDLRSLLTHEHFFSDTRMDFDGSGTVGFSYNRHLNQDPGRYPAPLADEDPQNYLEYFDLDGGGAPDSIAFAVGEKSYDALRTFLDLGVTPQPGYDGLDELTGFAGTVDREFANPLNPDELNLYWQERYAPQGLADFAPRDFYNVFGGVGPGGGLGDLNDGNAPSGISRPFGLESLADLLAFNGVNDDRTRSPLEAALGQRGDYNIIPSLFAARFSPLRDNRATDYERTRFILNRGNVVFLDEAKAAMLTDVRQHLTTHSGARPFSPEPILTEQFRNEFRVNAGDLPLDDDTLKAQPGTLFDTADGLFEFYADTLAPWSGLRDGGTLWDDNNTVYPRYATLFYGHRGPHLAVRTAAHLAVNMRDAYDDNNSPSIRTLVLDGDPSFRNTELDETNRDVFYPWQLFNLDEGNTTPVRLPNHAADTVPADLPRAVNIHGIEAQPFLVEVASMIMHADAPGSNGGPGDDDWPDEVNGVPIPRRPTIDGTPQSSNADCLMEVLVFQLHNPFDQSVTITGSPLQVPESANYEPDAQRGQYYIEYDGNAYKLSEFDNDGNELATTDVDGDGDFDVVQPITIGAGQSRNFYVLSGDPAQIAARWNDARDDEFDNQPFTVDDVNGWLDDNLTIDGVTPKRIMPFNPQTGAIQPISGGFDRLHVYDPSAPNDNSAWDQKRTVSLKRIEWPAYDAGRTDTPITFESNVEDVQTPGTPNFLGNDTVVDRLRDSVVSGEPTLIRHYLAGGNSEISGADAGQEPGGPGIGGESEDNRGLSIISWARLARRGDPTLASEPRGLLPAYCLELKDQTTGNATNDAADDPQGDTPSRSDFDSRSGDETVRDLVNKGSSAIPTLAQDPWAKDDAEVPISNIGANLANFSFAELQTEPHLDNDRFEDVNNLSTMRIADILLPLGIGPHQIPDPAFNLGDPDIEWTTLSEALAYALYYENPPIGESVYADAFNPTLAESNLLDRGQLRLDDYIPFFDNDENGEFDPTLDPLDARWGVGVPMAASLLDRFTHLSRRYGSLTSPTHGVLNINTVSRETARAIPGLSPGAAQGPDGSATWWWGDTDHGERSDIATTLIAFRDRLSIHPKDVTGAENVDETLNFRDSWDLVNGARNAPDDPGLRGLAPGSLEAELAGDNARQGATGIIGLAETPGFRSLGAVLLLRDGAYITNDGSYPDPHAIDRLGFDFDNITEEGVDSLTYSDGGTGRLADTIDDDYDEQLAVANAALGSTSIRSDYFVAWFVVHGYRESDVINLRQEDPMIPSIARRFMMVIDRSNVVEPGDRPRILMFREVPL